MAAYALAPAIGLAQGSVGSGGVNVGFDVNWGVSSTGYMTSLLNSDGGTVTNCQPGPFSASTKSCSFAFTYSVGGVAQTPAVPGGAYGTWPAAANGVPGIFCMTTLTSSNVRAPLTLFNCVNVNTWGQLFAPTATGALSGVTMNMTCLNPVGTPPTGLVALLYQMTNSGQALSGAPLAMAPVDLSNCPTMTSWQGHAFSAGDFATIPLNFSGVTVSSGAVYGVFFTGLAPGVAPQGVPTVTAVNPATGPIAGSTVVTITGSGFTGATAVKFGAVNALAFAVNSDTQITATSPAGAPVTVDVAVTAGIVTSIATVADRFTYFAPPLSVPVWDRWAMLLILALLTCAAAFLLHQKRKS